MHIFQNLFGKPRPKTRGPAGSSRRDQEFQLPAQDDDHRHHHQHQDYFSSSSSMRGNQPRVLTEVLRTIQKLSERNGSQPSTILSHILVAKRLQLRKPLQQIRQALTCGLKAGLIRDVGKGKVKLGMSPREYNAFKRFIDAENNRARTKMQRRKKGGEATGRKERGVRKTGDSMKRKNRGEDFQKRRGRRPKTKPKKKNVVVPNIRNTSTASNATLVRQEGISGTDLHSLGSRSICDVKSSKQNVQIT